MKRRLLPRIAVSGLLVGSFIAWAATGLSSQLISGPDFSTLYHQAQSQHIPAPQIVNAYIDTLISQEEMGVLAERLSFYQNELKTAKSRSGLFSHVDSQVNFQLNSDIDLAKAAFFGAKMEWKSNLQALNSFTTQYYEGVKPIGENFLIFHLKENKDTESIVLIANALEKQRKIVRSEKKSLALKAYNYNQGNVTVDQVVKQGLRYYQAQEKFWNLASLYLHKIMSISASQGSLTKEMVQGFNEMLYQPEAARQKMYAQEKKAKQKAQPVHKKEMSQPKVVQHQKRRMPVLKPRITQEKHSVVVAPKKDMPKNVVTKTLPKKPVIVSVIKPVIKTAPVKPSVSVQTNEDKMVSRFLKKLLSKAKALKEQFFSEAEQVEQYEVSKIKQLSQEVSAMLQPKKVAQKTALHKKVIQEKVVQKKIVQKKVVQKKTVETVTIALPKKQVKAAAPKVVRVNVVHHKPVHHQRTRYVANPAIIRLTVKEIETHPASIQQQKLIQNIAKVKKSEKHKKISQKKQSQHKVAKVEVHKQSVKTKQSMVFLPKPQKIEKPLRRKLVLLPMPVSEHHAEKKTNHKVIQSSALKVHHRVVHMPKPTHLAAPHFYILPEPGSTQLKLIVSS